MSTQILLAIIGVGGVGKALLQQLSVLQVPAAGKPTLVFAARSQKQIYSADYSPVEAAALETSTSPVLSLPQLAGYLQGAPKGSKVVVVDNTSNQDVADFYPEFLQRGISVITPNKKAFSSSLQLWHAIFSAAYPANQSGGLVYHESSVGAGLPVISTLKELIATGDQVRKIEGIFSGTMSFLFNQFQPADQPSSAKWSEIVAQAKAAGYTEPDPRDDLNGMDVARKCTILARLAGLPVESPTAFPVQSLIPSQLESVGSADEFMQRLPEFDGEMEKYKVDAEKAGKVVRFVGSVDVASKKVEVGLRMIEKGTPIASLKGSDNLLCFYTQRYGQVPLVVQGAGAGNDVTAMGVSGDLIKVIERLNR